ncbi:MAG: hypothetical protein FWD28_04330 [Treponema sp.]|nr:hypothetical protein [Treponema sp.]
MLAEMNETSDNLKNSKLLALFNTLEEGDKDIVILMSEYLVEKYSICISKTNEGFFNEESGYIYRNN